MKSQVSQHFGECCQVTGRGVTEPGRQADSPGAQSSGLDAQMSAVSVLVGEGEGSRRHDSLVNAVLERLFRGSCLIG